MPLRWDESSAPTDARPGGWTPAHIRMAVRRERRAKRLGYHRLTDLPHVNVAGAVVLLAGAIALATAYTPSREQTAHTPLDLGAVRHALADVSGQPEGADYRVSLPRSDLSVHVAGVAVEPELALQTRVLFSGTQQRAVADGELVVTESEVPGALRTLAQSGFDVTDLHLHPPAAMPAIVHVHIHKEGDPAALARDVRGVLARTGTPLQAETEPPVMPHPMFDRIRQALAREVHVIGRVLHVTTASRSVHTDVRVQPGEAENVLAAADFVVPDRLVSTITTILTEAGATLTGMSRLPSIGSDERYQLHVWLHGSADTALPALRRALSVLEQN